MFSSSLPVPMRVSEERHTTGTTTPSLVPSLLAMASMEAEKGNAEQVSRRMEVIRGIPELDAGQEKIEEVAKSLILEHALPENEVTDAYHIATAAFFGMDVLLTWNCRHMANEFTLPKTYGVLRDAGLKCPVIITPKRYMEDASHDE